jgi:3-phenylpropionate/trans-cinnamate dioxygenase ferredoxin reductase component
MSDVVIVGAGHAGSHLAVSLKAEGFGGPVTLIDSEEHLPYHKPPLSRTFLKSPTAEPQWLRAETAYDESGVTRLVGRVATIDVERRAISVDGSVLAYDDLVLATGAGNRPLQECQGATNVFSLRMLGDALALRDALPSAQRIVVIGGGFGRDGQAGGRA